MPLICLFLLHETVKNVTCLVAVVISFVFFFSSRRRHTRLVSDWSSDVCSSDLPASRAAPPPRGARRDPGNRTVVPAGGGAARDAGNPAEALEGARLAGPRVYPRSEERRVGKEGRSRWSPYH